MAVAAPSLVRTRPGESGGVDPPDPSSLTGTQRARRERIVDQAFELLLTREYDDIQIKEVAEGAGVALGTVYRYFTSKEHLFAAALVKWGDALRSRVRRSPLRGTDVASRLCEVYLRAIDAFERRPQFFRALVVIENTTDRHAHELWKEFGAVSSAAFDQPLSTVDPDTAADVSRALLHVLHGELRAWSRGSRSIDDVRRAVTATIDLLLR